MFIIAWQNSIQLVTYTRTFQKPHVRILFSIIVNDDRSSLYSVWKHRYTTEFCRTIDKWYQLEIVFCRHPPKKVLQYLSQTQEGENHSANSNSKAQVFLLPKIQLESTNTHSLLAQNYNILQSFYFNGKMVKFSVKKSHGWLMH